MSDTPYVSCPNCGCICADAKDLREHLKQELEPVPPNPQAPQPMELRYLLDNLAKHYFGYKADWSEAEAIRAIEQYGREQRIDEQRHTTTKGDDIVFVVADHIVMETISQHDRIGELQAARPQAEGTPDAS